MIPSSPDPILPSRLEALVFTDIVDSSSLKSHLGLDSYLHALHRHNSLFQQSLQSAPGSSIVKHTGDGFFARFPTASSASRAMFQFQQLLTAEPWPNLPLRARVGIHLGEVAVVQLNDQTDIVGTPADVAARIMSLASPNQILLSSLAADEAKRFLPNLRWTHHGLYTLKGADTSIELWELSNPDNLPLPAPLRPPTPPSTTSQRIGPYTLLEPLGEGGMGLVYKAEQRHPVRRTVALKLIKAGMDTRAVLARFDAERQALAMMDHPNIAKVLDAGADDRGRPFFVMEFVPGLPLTTYADQRKLDLPTRLSLFAQVCDAVHHAHQKGIIHRDLKPSNILVADVDGKPCPKVIDFGVAKATARRLTDATLFTEQGQLIGTPEYMSPEQADLSSLDIDTRSDVYSLGVVLYELLAGALPFDPKSLRAAAIGEIQRIIRDDDPPKPSTRLSSLDHAAGTDIAAHRQISLPALANQLRRELEWVPLKAMRKDRNHRYRSAAELADDVRNYLSGQPLLAAPESPTYKFKKYLRRHRGPAAAAAIISLCIMGGITATVWQTHRAVAAELEENRQRILADQRASESQAVAKSLSQEQQHTRSLLANQYTREAFLAVERGEPARGLLYLAKIITTKLGDSETERLTRIRFASILSTCPKPVDSRPTPKIDLSKSKWQSEGKGAEHALVRRDQNGQITGHYHIPESVIGFSTHGSSLKAQLKDGKYQIISLDTGQPLTPAFDNPIDEWTTVDTQGRSWIRTPMDDIIWIDRYGERIGKIPVIGVSHPVLDAVGQNLVGVREWPAKRTIIWQSCISMPAAISIPQDSSNCAIIPGTHYILTSAKDAVSIIFDADTRKPRPCQLPNAIQSKDIEYFSAGNGGNFAAICSDGQFFVGNALDGKTYQPQTLFKAEFGYFSHDANRVVIVGDNKSRVWDMTKREWAGPDASPAKYCSLNEDGSKLLACDSAEINFINVSDGKTIIKLLHPNDAHFFYASLQANQNTIAAIDSAGVLSIWDQSTGAPLSKRQFFDKNQIARFSQDGQLIAASSFQGGSVINLQTGKTLVSDCSYRDAASHYYKLTYPRISKDGSMILWSGARSGLWSMRDGQPLILPLPGGHYCAISDQNDLIVVTGNKATRAWFIKPFTEPGQAMELIAETLDGHSLDDTGVVRQIPLSDWLARFDTAKSNFPSLFVKTENAMTDAELDQSESETE